MLLCAVVALLCAGLRLLNMADDRATALGVAALAIGVIASNFP